MCHSYICVHLKVNYKLYRISLHKNLIAFYLVCPELHLCLVKCTIYTTNKPYAWVIMDCFWLISGFHYYLIEKPLLKTDLTKKNKR